MERIKDANEYLMSFGADALRACIQNAEPYPIEGVIEVADKVEEIRQLYREGLPRGVSTGWLSLDKYYTVRPGQFTVVTGIPMSGKSNFLDCLLVNLAKEQGWCFGLFSPENQPVELHMSSLAEKYLGIPFSLDKERLAQRMTEDEVNQAMGWVNDRFKWILPNDETHWTLDNILTIAGQMCLRYGIRGFVLDPWNELEASRPREMTETEFISQSLKRLRVFARMRDVHMWVVIHPAKLHRDKEGNYPVPTLYDCHGSAHWRNKADNGIVVWRDLSDNGGSEVVIYVQKVRFRQIGGIGNVTFKYERVCATYRETGLAQEARRGVENPAFDA